jgi:hypothetical protein
MNFAGLHVGIVRPFAALGHNPGDVPRRVFDVTGLAVNAILMVNLAWRFAFFINTSYTPTGQ